MTVTPNAPILRRSLHDELVDRLRRRIVEGELRPGEKVPERELTEQFGVSRTPLREALKVLASEGLVTLTPNRGATVTPLTEADLDEAFPVMGALEALSGEMACRRIRDEEIAAIRELHARMLAAYDKRDLPAYFAANEAIHEAILAAARNGTLTGVYHGLSGRVRRARYLANLSPVRWRQAVAEHEEMLEALEARDGERLAAILRRHLKHKLETVRLALRAGETEGGEETVAE